MERNPFGSVNSPGFQPPSLKIREASAELSSGQGVSYDVRRSDLKPEVRKCADKMHARLLGIYKKYGASDAEGMQRNVLAGKGPKLNIRDVEEADRLLKALDRALSKNELPSPELPPLEAFRSTIDKINAEIAPLKVVGLGPWDSYELINGKLNGAMALSNHRILPIIGGELVEEIDGKRIRKCREIKNSDGSLNGLVQTEEKELFEGEDVGDREMPVINGKMLKTIHDSTGTEFAIIRSNKAVNVSGKLEGTVEIENGFFPVVGGRLVTEVEYGPIHALSILGGDYSGSLDGKFIGTADFADDIRLPVVAGIVIKTVKDAAGHECEFKTVQNVQYIDGKLNCMATLVDGRIRPVVDGVLVEKLVDADGIEHPVDFVMDFDASSGGLNGMFFPTGFEDGVEKRCMPVIQGRPVQTVRNRAGKTHWIVDCKKAINRNGELQGKVRLSDNRWLPVINGVLVEEIHGVPIELDPWRHPISDAGGVFSGWVYFRDMDGNDKERRVLLGEFVV